MGHFARLAGAYRGNDRVAFTAVLIMEAHPTFTTLDSEAQDQLIAELRDAGVRVVWDVPVETGVEVPGLGPIATSLCAWPARAQWVAPNGVIEEESRGGRYAFTRARVRTWLERALGAPSAGYWVDQWFARGKARGLYWLHSLGVGEELDCGGACPIRAPMMGEHGAKKLPPT